MSKKRISTFDIFKNIKEPESIMDSKLLVDASDMSTDQYTQFYEQYIEYNCNEAIRRVKSKELNSAGVHAFIRHHIPIRGFNESTVHALRISEDCLKQLYEYSKEMNFIPKDYSYDDFITYHQLSPDDIVSLKNGGKIEKGECAYVWDNGIRIEGAVQKL